MTSTRPRRASTSSSRSVPPSGDGHPGDGGGSQRRTRPPTPTPASSTASCPGSGGRVSQEEHPGHGKHGVLLDSCPLERTWIACPVTTLHCVTSSRRQPLKNTELLGTQGDSCMAQVPAWLVQGREFEPKAHKKKKKRKECTAVVTGARVTQRCRVHGHKSTRSQLIYQAEVTRCPA